MVVWSRWAVRDSRRPRPCSSLTSSMWRVWASLSCSSTPSRYSTTLDRPFFIVDEIVRAKWLSKNKQDLNTIFICCTWKHVVVNQKFYIHGKSHAWLDFASLLFPVHNHLAINVCRCVCNHTFSINMFKHYATNLQYNLCTCVYDHKFSINIFKPTRLLTWTPGRTSTSTSCCLEVPPCTLVCPAGWRGRSNSCTWRGYWKETSTNYRWVSLEIVYGQE